MRDFTFWWMQIDGFRKGLREVVSFLMQRFEGEMVPIVLSSLRIDC
jgi:hypothetical protein